MTKLEEIEQAIAKLPPQEMAAFRNWYENFTAKLWDNQIEQDVEEGKLDDFARRALEDHKAGRTKEL